MAANQQEFHGVNIDTLEGFAEYVADNPDEVQLGLGAR